MQMSWVFILRSSPRDACRSSKPLTRTFSRRERPMRFFNTLWTHWCWLEGVFQTSWFLKRFSGCVGHVSVCSISNTSLHILLIANVFKNTMFASCFTRSPFLQHHLVCRGSTTHVRRCGNNFFRSRGIVVQCGLNSSVLFWHPACWQQLL